MAVTVARLDGSSAWRRYTIDASGGPWIRLDQRLADPAGLDAWYQAELRGTARGHRDLAGALIVYRVAGALAELVVGTLVDQRRCIEVGPAGLSLRFGDAARLDEVSVSAPAVAVLDGDPAAGEDGTHVVSSEAALRTVAVQSLVSVFEPLAAAVRARAPFGLAGMWGTLADHLAEVAVRRARERRGDVDAAWAVSDALIGQLAARVPSLRARPRRQMVTARAGISATMVAKGTCCLIYKAAGPPPFSPQAGLPRGSARQLIEATACVSCPLRSAEDREVRFARYLAQESDGPSVDAS